MLASTSWERGLAIRATSLSTLLFTALDLFRYSVASMLSDCWHTFCRGDPRCCWAMARAETPFLFVQLVGVRRKKVECGPRDRVGRRCGHIAVMQGYLFEGLDQWVHPPWEGEESVWAANHYPRWKMRPYLSCRRSTRKAVSMRSCSSDEPDPSWPLGLEMESGWTSSA